MMYPSKLVPSAISLILIVFIPFLNAFDSSVLNFKDINDKLEDLANIILRDYFVKNRCIVVITEKGFLKDLVSNNSRVNIEIDSTLEDCNMTLNSFLKETFKQNCDGYIVQLKWPRCALEGWDEVNRHKFLPRHNPKFFFLPMVEDSSSTEETTQGSPLDSLLSLRISDISQDILLGELHNLHSRDDWKVTLWTNNFYEHPTDSNRTLNKIYLDEWRPGSGFKENADLYPDKIRDLRGKRFRIATGTYLPFVNLEPPDGLEIRIAIQFCIIHNCTLIATSDGADWGAVYPNLTGNGALGNVYLDLADVGAYALYLWLDEHYYIDYSDSYIHAEVSVMTPQPKRLGGWATAFMPFKIDLWTALFLSMALSALSLYLITRASIKFTRYGEKLLLKNQFTTLEDSCMRAVGLVVLQQPDSRLIGDSPNRYLFTSFEFLYLILSAMYAAELASFLTVPMYEAPIDTYRDFAASGLNWYSNHLAWIYGLREGTDNDTLAVLDHFHVLPVKELTAVAMEGKYGFPVERVHGGAISEQLHITREVIPKYHIMKEYLYGSPVVLSIKKGSPYRKDLNRLVNQVFEHGLILYWEAETVRRYMDSMIQAEYVQAKTINVDTGPQVIRIDNIIGIIYLYLLGVCLACLLFIRERLWPPPPPTTTKDHSST